MQRFDDYAMRIDKIKLLCYRSAGLAASASALRSAGATGVVASARKFLKRIKLKKFKMQNESSFRTHLDVLSKRMVRGFPQGAHQNWGAARKVLNIFLRDVLYSRELCNHFRFDKFEKWLEVPLDGDVANGLHAEPEGKNLPRWKGIKRLNPEISKEYQDAAKEVAARLGIHPVDLDLIYWRGKQRKTIL